MVGQVVITLCTDSNSVIGIVGVGWEATEISQGHPLGWHIFTPRLPSPTSMRHQADLAQNIARLS